jgi:hypothetical protein
MIQGKIGAEFGPFSIGRLEGNYAATRAYPL